MKEHDAEIIKEAETARKSQPESTSTNDTTTPAAKSQEKISQKNSTDEDMLSERDREYFELAKDPQKNEKRLRELVDAAAEKSGYSRRMYHGSKDSADIKVFRNWQYFTENKSYAKRYAGKNYMKYLFV